MNDTLKMIGICAGAFCAAAVGFAFGMGGSMLVFGAFPETAVKVGLGVGLLAQGASFAYSFKQNNKTVTPS